MDNNNTEKHRPGPTAEAREVKKHGGPERSTAMRK